MPIGLSTGHRPLGLALKRGGPVVRNVLQDFGSTPLLAALRWTGASALMINQDLIAPDLACAVDDADLQRRLARNGYGFRDVATRRVLVTLPHGVEIMDLPRVTIH